MVRNLRKNIGTDRNLIFLGKIRFGSTIEFKKIRERPTCPGSEFPLWMQKRNGSRFSMGHINEKSLEQNNVRDSKFFSGYNSFHDLRRKYKKHRNTKGQEEIDELEFKDIINF
jgi:hypothetical protein